MANPQSRESIPWIGMTFECCGTYQRIYRTRDGTCYRGRCPRCYASVQVEVGEGGTSARQFRVR